MKGFIIKVLEIKASEKINIKYIEKFIFRHLELQNFKLSKKSLIYYSFIKPLKTYQILLFEGNSKNSFLPFCFDSKIKYELFLTKTFFVIYKENKVYNYQIINEDIKIEELNFFVNNSLKIDNITITKVSLKELEMNTQNNSHDFIRVEKSNTFKYYIIYIIFLCSFSYYIFFLNNNQNIKEINFNMENKNIERIKKSREFIFVSSFIIKLFEEAKNKKVYIVSLNLKNSKIKLKFESKSKDNIYKFLDVFSDYTIENINFDLQMKRYKTDVVFKIYRK